MKHNSTSLDTRDDAVRDLELAINKDLERMLSKRRFDLELNYFLFGSVGFLIGFTFAMLIT